MNHARWYVVRPAQNRKPTTYRCPLCGELLPALRPHALILPEGTPDGRRHAHIQCVSAARAAGRLPTQAEWQRASATERRPWWQRLLAALRR